MEHDQYEKIYREARERLVLRGKSIGRATYRDGIRYCPFEGLLLTDREVFREAWNEEIADEILREHTIVGTEAKSAAESSQACTECERLLLAYSLNNETYLDILRLRAETGIFRALVSVEVVGDCSRKRDEARQALMDHQHVHRGLALGSNTSG